MVCKFKEGSLLGSGVDLMTYSVYMESSVPINLHVMRSFCQVPSSRSVLSGVMALMLPSGRFRVLISKYWLGVDFTSPADYCKLR